MKNLNINKIWKSSYISEVEFYLLEWKNWKTLNSLDQAESVAEAIQEVKDIIENSKYKNIIPENDVIIAKIIYLAFKNNRTIQEQLDVFSKQIAPTIAMFRVEAWSIVADYANAAYRPNSSNPGLNIAA